MREGFLAGVLGIAMAVTALAGPETAAPAAANRALVEDYCTTCHNDALLVGNFSLENVDLARPDAHSAQLEKVILRCLNKDPDDRPASAEKLLALLEAVDDAGTWGRAEAREWWSSQVAFSVA